jgi:hypothetical protein
MMYPIDSRDGPVCARTRRAISPPWATRSNCWVEVFMCLEMSFSFGVCSGVRGARVRGERVIL